MNRKITEMLKIPESMRIPYFGGKWYQFLCKIDNKLIMEEKIQEKPLNKQKRKEKIIISLTSFPARINVVHLAIKSLLNQTLKADRIVLWLAESQFKSRKLPQELLDLVPYGLEICYCQEDLLGHKKHYMSIKNQKEDEIIVTYDDDIIYPNNSLEMLVKTHNKYPKCIVCNRAQAIQYDANGEIKNPGRWKTISNEGVKIPTYKLLPSNGGGVLYPYGSLFSDSYDVKKIKELCLRADDLWMMFMALKQGTKTIKTHKYHKTFSVIGDSQEQQLATGNIINNNYIKCLKNMINFYPDAWSYVTDCKKI